ncbi:hypothetical protein BKA56DRAFT_350840 [Ilyonectria sp. MPI-CAGE-AT-0026]|nr:hypothetical protein BKA56DRAFT_350840 [Ilyonectria sp. MPI-CAGE-AT-0026]
MIDGARQQIPVASGRMTAGPQQWRSPIETITYCKQLIIQARTLILGRETRCMGHTENRESHLGRTRSGDAPSQGPCPKNSWVSMRHAPSRADASPIHPSTLHTRPHPFSIIMRNAKWGELMHGNQACGLTKQLTMRSLIGACEMRSASPLGSRTEMGKEHLSTMSSHRKAHTNHESLFLWPILFWAKARGYAFTTGKSSIDVLGGSLFRSHAYTTLT